MPEPGAVLITGDAGAIGSATAQVFLELGWTVVGLDTAERSGVSDANPHLQLLVDVTDEEAIVQELQVLSSLPPLSHVVAIAGGALESEPKTQDDPDLIDVDDFRSSLDLNLTSQFITLKSSLPWLMANPDVDRSVTLTSSFNALSGQGMPAYSAAKAGLIGMMNALIGPLGAAGIRINTVAPGTIRTPRTERIWAHDPGHFERLGSSAALGKVGTPLDVANAFKAIALDLSHVTGQVMVVDGGQLKHGGGSGP